MISQCKDFKCHQL